MYQFQLEKHELEFIIPAKTSRNEFRKRDVFRIEIIDPITGKSGFGEAAPLALLSIDDRDDYEQVLEDRLAKFCETGKLEQVDLNQLPSIRFGLETALLSLRSEDSEILYNTPFTRGDQDIPINGLVWMDTCDNMYESALSKIEQGYTTIKFKVGAQDFDEECKMLERIRKGFSAFKITLRLDANGAFKPDEAIEQLNELKRFEIHSIEQPIAKDQWDTMEELCHKKPIDIALDEELIGVDVHRYGFQLLRHLKPQYIILKPNLLGGLVLSDQWVQLANNEGVGWWATSALEGNIGLNAIAQWVSQYPVETPQGLGTGALFKNNFPSRLQLNRGFMRLSV